MTEQEIHDHAVALWLDLVEFLVKNATDMGGDTSLPDLEDIADENAPKLMALLEARLQMVAHEAQDDYYEDNRA